MIEMGHRVAILASGDRSSGEGGSTAYFVARDALEAKVDLQIGVVICNNPEGSVGVYPKIDSLNRKFGLTGEDKIDVIEIGPRTHPNGKLERGQSTEESSAICRLLEERNIDFVHMLGYLRIVTSELDETWAWQPKYADDELFGFRDGLYHPNARILNNHPSILPFTADTHGHHAHEKAISLRDSGLLKYSAMSWHLATAEIDAGPMVEEMPVRIEDDYTADTLGDAVQKVEKRESAAVLERHLILRGEHLRANRS
jgi:folate-dependent phosphoribosylglycinamide formyltransferase PurN